MNNTTKKKDGAYALLTGFRRAIPIILVALALFIGLCFIIKDTGVLGNFISNALLGLFSIGGYFIPFFLAVHAFFYPSDHQKKRTVTRAVFTSLAIITISTMTHTIANFGEDISFSAGAAYRAGTLNEGGGFIGALLAFLLTKIFGTVGVIIIAVVLFALYVTYFFSGSRSAFSRVLLKLLNAISDFFSSRKDRKENKKQSGLSKREKKRRSALATEQELLTDDEFFAADNGMQELKIAELGIHEVRDKRELEANPHLQEKVFKSDKANETSQTRYTDFDYGAPRRERKVNTDYSTTDSHHGLYDNVSDTRYTPRSDDIIYDAQSDSKEKSAEEFFNGDFEPFDLKINEELSKKPSSKAEKKESEPEGISEFAEPIRNITEEDIERARQRADFEMKKRATAEARRLYEEAEEAARNSNYASYSEKPTEEEKSEPYIPEYMEEKTEEVEQNDDILQDTESSEEQRRKESFVSAIDDYERERDMEFKPYEPHIEEPTEEDGGSEDELKLTRTILDPYPTSADDDDDDEDSDEDGELDFSDGEDYSEEDFPDEKIPPEEQNEDVILQRQLFPFLSEEKEEAEEKEDDEELDEEPKEKEVFTDEKPPLIFERPRQTFEPERAPVKEEVKEEPKPEKPDYSDYQYPPLDLLLKGKFEEDTHQEEEKHRNAEILVDTLAQFNVRVSIKGVDRGPRITRYEIVPAKGIKVSKVMSLYNDIALNLGVDGMRMEAPIPGKSAIGVEIPNKNPTTVLLRDLVESDEFIRSASKTYACLGKDVTGNPVFADIAKMPHVLVAGATGMGKSVCINAILISILYKARPDEVKFIMIDPKKVEFNGYNGIPHLLVPVVTDVKQAAGTLMWAVEQMEKRYDLMEALEVKKLDDYNQKVRENPSLGEPLPKIIIVIDELNDIMLQVRKPAEDLIMSIAQKARAAGIHLIIGTQRPSVDVITGIIKANIPSRISCKVASLNDSRTILEQVGAEKLLNNGDMLYVSAGAPKALRVQGAFVSDPEVIGVMKFLKSQAKGAIYDSEALEEINRAAQKCSKSKDDDGLDDEGGENVGILNDQQFLDAVELAIRSGKISTSLMQRKIGVGYGKAAKFIDNMENLGIVSEPNGSKPRDILITKDEWHEMLARRSLD